MSTTSHEPFVTSHAEAPPVRSPSAAPPTPTGSWARRAASPSSSSCTSPPPWTTGTPHRRPHCEAPPRHHLRPARSRRLDRKVPNTIEEAADHAYEFITALGFDKIDAFTFSMGGFIVQDLIVKHPDLVRKLVLTGTGPAAARTSTRWSA